MDLVYPANQPRPRPQVHLPNLPTATGAITSSIETAMSKAAGATKDNLLFVDGIVITAATHFSLLLLKCTGLDLFTGRYGYVYTGVRQLTVNICKKTKRQLQGVPVTGDRVNEK